MSAAASPPVISAKLVLLGVRTLLLVDFREPPLPFFFSHHLLTRHWHLLQDTSVGKSCLVVKFCRNEFCAFDDMYGARGPRATAAWATTGWATAAILPRALFRPADDYQEPTIGAAFLTQTVQLPDATVRYELWDTAGQERYRTLAPMYYRGAAAAVVVYDVTNYSSFEGAKSWVKELQKKGEPGVVIALAGNKSDSKERKVEPEEAAEYAREAGCHHFSTSAKTGANVKEMFTHIARLLPKSGRGGEREGEVELAAAEAAPKRAGCCG